MRSGRPKSGQKDHRIRYLAWPHVDQTRRHVRAANWQATRGPVNSGGQSDRGLTLSTWVGEGNFCNGFATPARVNADATCCILLINSIAAAGGKTRRQAGYRRPVIGVLGRTSLTRLTPNSIRSDCPSKTILLTESAKVSRHSGLSTYCSSGDWVAEGLAADCSMNLFSICQLTTLSARTWQSCQVF